MSLWQFNTAAAIAGSASPTSASFESIASQTLEGVQSAQFAIVLPHEDAFDWQGGGDQVAVQRPRAELNLTWLFASGVNEAAIGLVSSPSGTISALSAANDERNYYLLVNQDNLDAIGHVDPGSRVLALGQGVLTRYGFSAQVGQPSAANATIEGLNLLIQPSGSNQPLPALHKQGGSGLTGLYTLPVPSQTVSSYFEAAPASIVLTFATGCALGVLLSGQNACPVESFGFTVELPRTEMRDLGWAYPAARPVVWPAVIGIQATARLNQFQLDALNRPTCPDTGHAFAVGFKNSCSTQDAFAFQFNGAKLDSQSIGVSVGGGVAEVSLSWSLKVMDVARVGPSAPNFYLTRAGASSFTGIVFPQVDYVSGSAPLIFGLSTPCFLSVVSGPGLITGGNFVLVTDEAATVVVRATAADGSDVQDVTVTVG